MKRMVGISVVVLGMGIFYLFSWLYCIAINDGVSKEDYARMSQELVEDSLNDGDLN